MKRTIEKLHEERRAREEAYQKKLDEFRQSFAASSFPGPASLEERLARLESLLEARETLGRKLKDALQPLSRKNEAKTADDKAFDRELVGALGDLRMLVDEGLRRQEETIASLAGLLAESSDLVDAKDKEWDALGSNHVGLIFKSMEWRVDGLAAEYEDVKVLMSKFLLLEDKLTRLLALLDEKKMPTRADVEAILEPLQDWRYAGFENRFRGGEAAVKAQQEAYAALFKKGGKVLDLGCGRGEFLELLGRSGVEAEGLDLNGLMVEACQAKGLNSRRGDLLQELAERPDGSLDGIFSSQVIEHLPPASIRRLVELAFAKLRTSGVLVLETVNPLSLFALVHIYFLDLTHLTPVHPQAAKFMLETAGFRDVAIRYSAPLERERLQTLPGADETASIINRDIDALNDLLFAPPNFAVIGTKR